MTDPQPLTLTYDNSAPGKDSNGRRIYSAHLLGIVLAGFLQAPAVMLLYQYRRDPTFGYALDGFIKPVVFAIVTLLPTSISLGITFWLRTKFLSHVRFAKFRTALLSGFIQGLYPIAILGTFSLTRRTEIALLLCGLAWHILFPIAAGFRLCHRSHLRD